MQNKRGQGLSTNTIILIILGVLVLVILVLGFALGWDKIASWISPSNNVNDVATSCLSFCNMKDRYNYCNNNVELKTEDGKFIGSCYSFSLADGYTKYGIEECEALNCKSYVECANWVITEDKEDMPVKIGGVDMTTDSTGNYCTA